MPPTAALPIPRALHVETLLLDEEGLTVLASSEATAVRRPVCGAPTDRVHRRHVRPLADRPWAGRAVRFRVPARRFCCDNAAGPRTIFAERLAGIARGHARRTDRQREALEASAFVAGGEAGARLAAARGDPVSPDARLRLIRDAPEAAAAGATGLGVDDRAFRTGRRSGTLLVDLERHRPIDPLPDRTAESPATWLTRHPGGRPVGRDRAGADAEGMAAGAPPAVRVADRWHPMDTLRATMQPALERPRERWPALPVPAAPATGAAAPPPATPDRACPGSSGRRSPRRERPRQTARARRLDRHERGVARRQRGGTGRRIARGVGIGERTVHRWWAAGHFPGRKRRAEAGRPLDAHRPFLDRRGAAGGQTVARLCRERRDQGDTGSGALAYGDAAFPRTGIPPPGPSPPAAPAAPSPPARSPREIGWRLLRPTERLAGTERRSLDDVRRADPAPATVVDLPREFGAMVRGRRPDRRDAWLRAANASGPAEFPGLAAGSERAQAAVAAALAERRRTGQTDGQALRLKPITRQGHGRAKFDLLRQRVLRAA